MGFVLSECERVVLDVLYLGRHTTFSTTLKSPLGSLICYCRNHVQCCKKNRNNNRPVWIPRKQSSTPVYEASPASPGTL